MTKYTKRNTVSRRPTVQSLYMASLIYDRPFDIRIDLTSTSDQETSIGLALAHLPAVLQMLRPPTELGLTDLQMEWQM